MGSIPFNLQNKPLHTAFLLTILAFLFFYLTLSPTVLWGDDAYFQIAAHRNSLRPDGSNHLLWLKLANWLSSLPIGDGAFRVNLASALPAAVTIGLLYLALRNAQISHLAAVLAASAFAVSHTFWTHAVRAEVYALFLAIATLQLCFMTLWQKGRPWPIYAAVGLSGLSLIGHQMGILFFPALAVLIILRFRWLDRQQIGKLTASLLAGLALFFAFIATTIEGDNFTDQVVRYFTVSAEDFSGAMFDYSISALPRDAFFLVAFLGLQFAGFAFLFGLMGVFRPKKRTDTWQAILVLYLVSIAFAFSYRVNDQFVFYLPSYLAFTFFIGWGWDSLAPWLKTKSNKLSLAIIVSMLVFPPLIYRSTSAYLASSNRNPLGIRELPYREPNTFFLWPSKRGYDGARQFAREALEQLPENAVLIADYTAHQPLIYLQEIEAVRTDVELAYPGALNRFVTGDEIRPIYIVDTDPNYYKIDTSKVQAEKNGNIYRINLLAPPN